MPELPEVETIRRQLQPQLLGACIRRVSVARASVIRQPAPVRFVSMVRGAVITGLQRRGKLLLLQLRRRNAETAFLVIHLRMSGQCILGAPQVLTRVAFELTDQRILCYNDQRCLGELRLVADWRTIPLAGEMGPEPFDRQVTPALLRARFTGRKTPIKALLLDQRIIAGVGNIYVCEALFAAGIAPQCPAGALSDARITKLLVCLRRILRQAINRKGTTFSLYRDANGGHGDFYRHLRVYDRSGQPCLVCGGTIERIQISGRGTYYCPGCQS